jgi:FixJ family two-component response regulator
MSAIEKSVFLVDDDPGVRKALARVLEADGWRVEKYESAEAFLARPDQDALGCVVLDVNLPGLDGLEVQRRLAEAGRVLPIVFLTGQGDIPTSVRAIKAGAADFLTKPVAADVLLSAVRAALAAQTEGAELRQRLAALSQREREVLAGVVAGKLNKQIADELGVSERTVKSQRAQLMDKLGAGSSAELGALVERLRSLADK